MTTTLTRQPVPVEAEDAPREYRWTTDAFYLAADAGVFADPARLELIHGRIIEKMPISPLHTALTNIIADSLRAVLSPRLTVRVESAIHIAFDGEPIPDVAVVSGSNLDYLSRHPAPEDVRLLVEVALTSAEYDMGGKTLLYAQAGITEYWVVLPASGEIVTHREPSAGRYLSIARLGAAAMISPLAAPDAALPVRELLGRSLGEAEFGVHQG